MPPQPRFLADGMLGSLARWLRIIGCDTSYAHGLEDAELLHVSEREGRVLLTRDIELAGRASPRSLLIASPDLDEQMLQVVQAFGLRAEADMSRCTACNGTLHLVPKETLSGTVPQGSLDSHQEFYRCQSCGKAYWKGSHWTSIQARLSALEARAGRSPR